MNKQAVREEHSAGGCVGKKWAEDSGRWTVKWLLGKHSGYHKWVLPKGLIEKGENAAETAIREVEEETGVKAKMVDNQPIYEDHYSYQAEYKTNTDNSRRVAKYQENGGEGTKVNKTVTYYLMEWMTENPKGHDFEMDEVGWFTYEEAMEKLDFEGEKRALQQAQSKLL